MPFRETVAFPLQTERPDHLRQTLRRSCHQYGCRHWSLESGSDEVLLFTTWTGAHTLFSSLPRLFHLQYLHTTFLFLPPERCISHFLPPRSSGLFLSSPVWPLTKHSDLIEPLFDFSYIYLSHLTVPPNWPKYLIWVIKLPQLIQEDGMRYRSFNYTCVASCLYLYVGYHL